MQCEICETPSPRFSWTDTHGVAQCCKCGAPYTVLHYEGEGDSRHRVEKEPEIVIKPEYIPVFRAYWQQVGRIIPSGCSFPGGQELVSQKDHEEFYNWMELNAEAMLKETLNEPT